jgi:hypothetical protein
MRWILALLAASLIAAQDQDPAERIGKRVGDLLDSELKKLEQELKGFSARTPEPAKPPPTEVKKEAGVDAVLGKITAESIREIVTTIAGDDYEGRCAGYPGNDKTCEYFSKIYAAAGLAPVGDKDDAGKPTYLQHLKIQGRRTQNTVAYLEGSDPRLKHELVVIGGHHDHLGKGNQGPAMQRLGGATEDDKIWNGADDNGSGSGTIVAVAKAFGESGARPRRSILFMTFTGEEWGLLGSRYYTDNPIFPLEKTVAMINIDMIGRNPQRPVDCRGLGTEAGDMFEKMVDRAAARTGLNVKQYQEPTVMGGDSDHSNFRAHRIPVMFFFSGLHPDYHKVSDHPDKLAFGNMEKIGRSCALILWELATQDDRPKFAGSGGGRMPRFEWPDEKPPETPARKLGFLPSYRFAPEDMDKLGLAKEEGGILVESVSEDSVASKAGLKKGDIILSIGEKKLSRPVSKALSELKDAIAAAKPKTPVPIVALRGKERLELKAEFEE